MSSIKAVTAVLGGCRLISVSITAQVEECKKARHHSRTRKEIHGACYIFFHIPEFAISSNVVIWIGSRVCGAALSRRDEYTSNINLLFVSLRRSLHRGSIFSCQRLKFSWVNPFPLLLSESKTSVTLICSDNSRIFSGSTSISGISSSPELLKLILLNEQQQLLCCIGQCFASRASFAVASLEGVEMEWGME